MTRPPSTSTTWASTAPWSSRSLACVKWEGAVLAAAADGGELTYHRMAELYFEDQAALEQALGTDEGKATAKDYGQIAPPGSRMFVAAVDD